MNVYSIRFLSIRWRQKIYDLRVHEINAMSNSEIRLHHVSNEIRVRCCSSNDRSKEKTNWIFRRELRSITSLPTADVFFFSIHFMVPLRALHYLHHTLLWEDFQNLWGSSFAIMMNGHSNYFSELINWPLTSYVTRRVKRVNFMIFLINIFHI